MFPGGFTVTSHIIVTFALAALVIGTVLVYGFAKHGLRFLRLFVPSGVPVCILPLVALIEVISFLSRPISLSVRLFANMLAGHITLKVFAGFVASLGALGAVGVARRRAAARHDRGADRARASGRGAAGLRLHHADLHLPQRRPSSRPLTRSRRTSSPLQPVKELSTWIPTAAKFIGAGLACLGMGGAGIGVGLIFGELPRGRAAQPVGRRRPVRAG